MLIVSLLRNFILYPLGDFGKIRSNFKQLMRHYVHALFEERLHPKCIHGSYVTGEELLTYVKAYTTVFCKAEVLPFWMYQAGL